MRSQCEREQLSHHGILHIHHLDNSCPKMFKISVFELTINSTEQAMRFIQLFWTIVTRMASLPQATALLHGLQLEDVECQVQAISCQSDARAEQVPRFLPCENVTIYPKGPFVWNLYIAEEYRVIYHQARYDTYLHMRKTSPSSSFIFIAPSWCTGLFCINHDFVQVGGTNTTHRPDPNQALNLRTFTVVGLLERRVRTLVAVVDLKRDRSIDASGDTTSRLYRPAHFLDNPFL
jgi:hypothetical protein